MSTKKQSFELLPSAARIASPDDIVISEPKVTLSEGSLYNIHIIIDVTAVAATPSIQPKILATDKASGKTYELLPGIAAITAIGTTVLKVGKDIVAAAGLAAQDLIPENVVLELTHVDADSITYSVGMNTELNI